jgi:hypothetical protein
MTIHVPEFGWQGDRKKVEFRDEKLIRATFEYAYLIGTDFTEAMRRALLLALPLIIENEKLAQARLTACFAQSNNNSTASPVAFAQPPIRVQEESEPIIPVPKIHASLPEPESLSKSTRSAADLI